MNNKKNTLILVIVSFFLLLLLNPGYTLEMTDFPYSEFTSVCPVGDVDGNSVINIVDALIIAQTYVGLTALKQPASGDTDLDGKVTIVDALRVAQYFVGLIQQTAIPGPDLAGGWYNSSRSMTISCDTADAKIYYTTDGSFPLTGSRQYSAPVLIGQTTDVQVVAMKQGELASNILSVNYAIGDNIVKKGVWECPYFIDTEKISMYYAIKDNYLYACAHYVFTGMPPDYLIIYDLSDPLRVKKVGSMELDFSVGGFTIAGDYAYISVFGENIRIYDISDPIVPRYISAIEPYSNMIKIDGDYGYVNYGNRIITIVDLHNLAAPAIISTFEVSGGFLDSEIYGNYIYFAKGSAGIQIMNIKDKSNPSVIAEYAWPENHYVSQLEVSGNYLFLVAVASGQLLVMDITDPAQPGELSRTTLPFRNPYGAVAAFVLENDVITVSSGYEQYLVMYDVSAPASPRLIYQYFPSSIVSQIFSSGNTVYIREGYHCFKKFNITDKQQPCTESCIDMKLSLSEIIVEGNYAYAYDHCEGIKIFDVSDPAAPFVISQVFDETFICDLFVRGGLLYITSRNGFTIMDIRNPAQPKKLSNLQLYSSNPMYLKGQYAYLVNNTDGLIIIDVKNQNQPVLISKTKTNHLANAVYVPDAANAFISDMEARILRMDITDPANPVKMNIFGTYVQTMLRGYGNYLFSCSLLYDYFTGSGNEEYSLEITDVTDPLNPLKLSTTAYPQRLNDIFIAGDFALVSCLNQQAELLDISAPDNPRRLGMLSDSENARGILVSGKYIYVTKDITSEQSPEALVIYEIQ